MTLIISQKEVDRHLLECAKITATRLGIYKAILSESGILAEVEKKDPMATKILRKFLWAYRQWHQFHVKVDQNNHAGRLSPEEQQELRGLIVEREEWRKSLLLYLNHLAQGGINEEAQNLYNRTLDFLQKAAQGIEDEAYQNMVIAQIITPDGKPGLKYRK